MIPLPSNTPLTRVGSVPPILTLKLVTVSTILAVLIGDRHLSTVFLKYIFKCIVRYTVPLGLPLLDGDTTGYFW